MPSLMNALGSMGAGVAAFAGQAGLEAQKAQLQQQGIVLAANLAQAGKSAELTQQAGIAAGAAQTLAGTQAAAAEKGQEYAMALQGPRLQNALDVAQKTVDATLGAARISATQSGLNVAAEVAGRTGDIKLQLAQSQPLVDRQVDTEAAKAGLTQDQQANAHLILGVTQDLALELSKPPEQQDQAKIGMLHDKMIGLTQDAKTVATTAAANNGLVEGARSLVNADNADIARLTADATNPIVKDDPAALAQVNAELKGMHDQLVGHLSQLNGFLTMGRALVTHALGGPGAPAPGAGGDPTKYYKPPAAPPVPQPPAAAPGATAPPVPAPY